MEYKEAINYLMNIPMFQNVGAKAYNPSLDTISELCREIGDPQRSFASIHVAGTNGKGSVSALLASTFESKGLKCALFTSPHLVDFRERIKINSEMIPEDEITLFFSQNIELIERLKPSFFELTTAIAFWWFARERVDIAIIECGLGGRLDATNIIKPMISVITNISKDHTSILGSTLEEIAREKSGIIKLSTPVVIGEWEIESALEIMSIAKTCNSDCYIASQRYQQLSISHVDNFQIIKFLSLLNEEEIEVETNLSGQYQAKNIATALTVLDILNEQSSLDITKDDIKRAFIATSLKGRWQTISKEPRVICDVGHNEAGIREVVESLKRENYDKLYFILGVVNDKDIETILSLLPKDAEYIFTKSSVERALNEEELQSLAEKQSLNGTTTPTVAQALELAKSKAKSNDLIVIGGSCFTVGEAISCFE